MLLSPATIGAIQQDPIRRTFRQSSLDLRFADNKSLVDAQTGANLVTFTRASSATYVGSDGLVKSAVTNLLLRSEEFDNASWTKTASSITPDDTTAPNGFNTADKIIDTAVNTTHFAQQTITPVASTAYTYSCYLKAGERTQGAVGLTGAGNADSVVLFNLSTGTYISTTGIAPTAFSIAFAGNGWYRCSITWTTASTATMGARSFVANSNTITFAGNGTSGIYLWGAQLETGAFPTSYIPTTTTTVTRAADVASITGSNFSSFYNQTEGTVFAEGAILNTGNNRFIADITDSGVNEEIGFYWSTGFNSLVNDNGVAQANSFGGTVTANSRTLHSFGYKLNDFQGYGNAVALFSDTAGTLPTVDRLTIGSRVNSTFWANGTIKRLTYWPTRLADTTLQSITL
jgi:hypothetical protein